jgi:DNA-binding response OmpR family regulator
LRVTDDALAGNTDAGPTHPTVTIVFAVIAPTAHSLAAELRRDSLRVEVANAEVLQRASQTAVYVFWFEAALGVALAERICDWAASGEARSGLIGVLEDGGGHEREALLAAGFDDVVAGNLGARELSARVRAVHRRMSWSAPGNGRLRFAGFTLDVRDHALWVDGATISLTSIELAVMRELVRARGRPLSRAALLDAAWGDADQEISERAVDNVILRLRRKLPRPEALETVRSVGFRIAE